MGSHQSENNQQYGPLGQMYYWFNSPAGSPDFTTPYEVSLENGPTVAIDRQVHHGAYVSDQIKIKRRAVLTVGGRWDYYRDYEPAETVRNDAPFRAFYYAGAALPNGYSIPATNANYALPAQQILRFPSLFAPRIVVVLDPPLVGQHYPQAELWPLLQPARRRHRELLHQRLAVHRRLPALVLRPAALP